MIDLAKINFMSRAQYLGLETRKDNEIYNVACAVVLESYRDEGGNWWRKWSDGWVEQGGIVNKTAASLAVNLLVPYRTGDAYSVFTQQTYTAAVADSIAIVSKSPTDFVMAGSTSNAALFIAWTACGQGA